MIFSSIMCTRHKKKEEKAMVVANRYFDKTPQFILNEIHLEHIITRFKMFIFSLR